jgi:hypothetical protein
MMLEKLGQLKKIHLIRTRSRDLLACSIIPQPTTLQSALFFYSSHSKEKCLHDIMYFNLDLFKLQLFARIEKVKLPPCLIN